MPTGRPQKPITPQQRVVVRMPESMHAALQAKAAGHFVSLNSEILQALTYWLSHQPNAPVNRNL